MTPKHQARLEAVGSIQRAADSSGKASRSFDFVCSTSDVDSSGRVVTQDWDLERYKKNPVVLWNHGMGASFFGGDDTDLTLPIGHASNIRVEDGKLKATLTIVDEKANPIAEKVYQGLLQGSLHSVSVGWWPRDVKYDQVDGEDVAIMSGNQLLEISVVPIPANHEAVKQAASMRRASNTVAVLDLERHAALASVGNALGLPSDASPREIAEQACARLASPKGGASSAPRITKPFAAMTYSEQAALYRENPNRWRAMRDAHAQRSKHQQ